MKSLRLLAAVTIVLALCATVLFAVTRAGGDGEGGGVTIEPLPSKTSTARAIPTGGKSGAPKATRSAAPAASATVEPAETPQAAATGEPPTPATTVTAPSAGPPTTGRWIEVDVTAFVVRLMEGAAVVREIAPVGVGEQIDTGAYLSTQTGLFSVHTKTEALAYDAAFDTYISHWVGFDLDKDNGFHSFLKDADGNVVDPSTGRVSNGCIRTGEAEAVYAFAEIGMAVWVHG